MSDLGKKTSFIEPLRSVEDIGKIKRHLRLTPKHLLLFTIGINSPLRVNTLLNMKKTDLKYLKVGDPVNLYGERFVFNAAIYDCLEYYNDHDDSRRSYLFSKLSKDEPIKAEYLTRLVKDWTRKCGIEGNFGGQTLRKTFGYINRVVYGADLKVLSSLYGHPCPSVTLRYLDIEDRDAMTLQAI